MFKVATWLDIQYNIGRSTLYICAFIKLSVQLNASAVQCRAVQSIEVQCSAVQCIASSVSAVQCRYY